MPEHILITSLENVKIIKKISTAQRRLLQSEVNSRSVFSERISPFILIDDLGYNYRTTEKQRSWVCYDYHNRNTAGGWQQYRIDDRAICTPVSHATTVSNLIFHKFYNANTNSTPR